jgi:hypothetical protein
MTDNEFDRTARAWLEDGPNRISDRALLSALEAIHATRQRRAWWPAQRESRMFTMFRIAAVAGAILLAIVGFGLLSSGVRPGPSPAPTPTPILLGTGDLASLVPGTYVTQEFLVPVTLTVPAGWEGHVGGPYFVDLGRTAGPELVGIAIFDTVYTDPCDFTKGPMDPSPGPSVDDLVTALVGLPELDVSTPTDITIDGYRGKQLTITAPSDVAGCTLSPEGNLRVWELPLGAPYGMNRGQSDRLIILDVEGQRIVIITPLLPAQSAATNAEIQAVLDSIRLEPAPPTASPS